MNNHNSDKLYRVTISPGNKTVTTSGVENLLTLLTRNSILLRSDCGGKGVCGKCRVDLPTNNGTTESALACTCTVQENLSIAIPETSLMSPHVINKAETHFPESFGLIAEKASDHPAGTGIAIDLGTTTVAVYLIDQRNCTILSSISFKNPQALYGDDVISRIGYIGQDQSRLERLQHMIAGCINWAAESLLEQNGPEVCTPGELVVVGNPAMIHILLGVNPASIGVSPYMPKITSSTTIYANSIGISGSSPPVHTLPNLSGFIGGDILAAAISTEMVSQPEGTLLVDLGTNGELLLKGREGYFATSCATGPAFEGATLSCGIQAIPGAIDKVVIGPDLSPSISTVQGKKGTDFVPAGVCGSGIISCIAECLRKGIVQPDGSFSKSLPEGVVVKNSSGSNYPLFTSSERSIFVSQKDIRNVQLGKAALISGIEFLLQSAGYTAPRKVIVAGSFGSHLQKEDLFTLGMLPKLTAESVVLAGNAAGAGAIMCLCSNHYLEQAKVIGKQTTIINLADDMKFQSHFIERLSFPS